MPTITCLKPQRNGRRVNVYVDNEFAFGIDLDNLVKFGIKIDKSFTKEELDKIIREAEFQKTYGKLLHFAMLRPRSEKEISNWFRRKEVPLSLQDLLLQKLKKLELVNDTAFTNWWVDQRLAFKKKSIKALKVELAQKGISRKIVENVLGEKNIDEEKLARDLLAKKSKKWERFEGEEKKKKMTEFLLRNGFNWEVAKKVAKE